jgi:ubiquitin-protein ligase
MAKEWLKYPREFRLIEETKESDPSINFGVVQDDIDLVKWNGIFHLTKSDIILSFNMICSLDFPDVAPKIFFDNSIKLDDIPGLKQICNDEKEIKSEILNWNSEKTIYEHLKKIYGRLNN